SQRPAWCDVDPAGPGRRRRPAPRGCRAGALSTPPASGSASVEHDSALAIEQNAMLHMPANCASQHQRFHVAAHTGQLVGAHAVMHALDVLFDDGAFVEVGGDVVRGGTDDLHATGVCLVVGAGTLEARQEAVMNVDGL